MSLDVGFTGGWLDRADHVRGDADALAGLAGDWRSKLLKLDGFDPVIDASGALEWTSLADASDEGELIFLGLDENGKGHFTETWAPGVGKPGRSMALMTMLGRMAPGDASVFGTARVLADWHSRHRFCAVDGNPTDVIRGGWARKCPVCATEHFPRVDPVVIMLAEHDGKALVGRGNGWPTGRYSALAGFVEPGESIEEAVAREIFEEAGIRVRDVRYVASQPWPFPGQLMLACIGVADEPAITIDPKEIEAAMWVTRDEVWAALGGDRSAPFIAPPSYAIAHSLLTEWAGRD